MSEPALVFVVPDLSEKKPLPPATGLSSFWLISSFFLSMLGCFLLVVGTFLLLCLFVVHAISLQYGAVEMPFLLSLIDEFILSELYPILRAPFGELEPFPIASGLFFVGLLLFWVLCLTPQIVLHFVLLYRAWACVSPLKKRWQEEGLTDSLEYKEFLEPKEAVGLLFVPGFQLYWSFPAYLRLPRYGREYARVLGVEYKGPSEKVSFWYPIFCLVSAFLGVAILFLPFFLAVLNQKFNALILSVKKAEFNAEPERESKDESQG